MSSASYSSDGIQLGDENEIRRSRAKAVSLPRTLPVEIVPETYWATTGISLTFQRRFISTWSSCFDLNYLGMDEEGKKSPSIDSGRETLNSRNSNTTDRESRRRNRHKRCFTSESMDSVYSSTTSSIYDKSDSDSTLSVRTDNSGSPTKKMTRKSSLPSFLRRSKKSTTGESPSSSKSVKGSLSSATKNFFQRKSKLRGDLDPVQQFPALEEEAPSLVSGTKITGKEKEKQKALRKAVSMPSIDTKDKETKSSPFKKLSIVKNFTKLMKGTTSKGKSGTGTKSEMETQIQGKQLFSKDFELFHPFI